MQVTINLNIDDRYINFFRKVFTKRKAVLALLLAALATNLNADTITKLYTFTAGNTIIASQVNDNFDQLFTKVNELDGIGASRMRVTKNDAQSIPDSTPTIVEYDDEDFDNLGEYDVTNHRFTATEAGYYFISASLLSANITWGVGVIWQMRLYKNGVAYSNGTRNEADITYRQSQISDIVYLVANDFIDIRVYHNQGVDVNTYVGQTYNYFTVHRLSK